MDRLLFYSFSIFTIVLLGAIICLSYYLTNKELVSNTSVYQHRLLQEINKQLIIQMNAIEQISVTSSRSIESMSNEFGNDPLSFVQRSNELVRFFQNVNESTSLIHSTYVYLENPPVTTSEIALRFFSLQQAANEPWYAELENNDGVWLGKHKVQNYMAEAQVISYIRKLYTSNGKTIGIIVINVKGDRIDNLLKGEEDHVNRVLLDGGGRQITSVGNVINSEQLYHLPRTALETSGQLKVNLRGQKSPSLIVWSGLSNQWFIAEETSWTIVTRGSWHIALWLIGIGVIAIFIALYYTLFIVRHFQKPIQLLLHTMATYPSENKAEFLPKDYSNEYGHMFNGYQRLMERIDELLESLQLNYRMQQKKESEALQAMINPHFLYNTLDQLNWMALEKGQKEISDVLSLIGKMFRIGLSHGEPFIPTYEEMTHVECYLQIQIIRWGEGITYNLEIMPQLYEYYIPRVTLQPFVENCFLHGFRGRKSGHIDFKATVVGTSICFLIEDDGRGLNPAYEEVKSNKKGGYGLRNVRERLSLYFGDNYSIELASREGGGTMAKIVLPQMSHPEEWGEKQNAENRSHR